MKIKDVMNHPVVTCQTTSTLDHPARLMWEYDCGVIPVINDAGQLAGVVTDRDICMAAYTQGRALHQIPISTVMTGRVIAAHVNDSVESVEHLMRDNQIRRIPVLDGDSHIAGMVSMNDLARLAERAKRSAVDRELVNTLAAVCQPRGHVVSQAHEELVASGH